MDQNMTLSILVGTGMLSNISIPNSMIIPTFLWNAYDEGLAACVVHLENESQAANKRVCERTGL